MVVTYNRVIEGRPARQSFSEGGSSNLASESPEIEVAHPNPSYYQIQIPTTYNLLSFITILRSRLESLRSQLSKVTCHLSTIKGLSFSLRQGTEGACFSQQLAKWLGCSYNLFIRRSFSEGGQPTCLAGRQGETIVIFYLPQLLEYLGFGILIAGVIWLIRKKV